EHDLFRKPVSTFRDHALAAPPSDQSNLKARGRLSLERPRRLSFPVRSAITPAARRPAKGLPWQRRCSISTLEFEQSRRAGRMASALDRKGEPNAQDQDEIGRQK